MNNELQGILIIGSIIAVTALFTRKPSSIDNLDPVDRNLPRFHAIRGPSDGDGTVNLKSTIDGQRGILVLRNGELFTNKDNKQTSGDQPYTVDKDGNKKFIRDTITASFTPDYYFFEPFDPTRPDVGTWVGYKSANRGTGESTYQFGLRFSPVRILYNTVSADVIASRESYGAGASLYPPAEFAGRFWSHWGIGAWYTLPFDSNDNERPPGWVFGLSFSTK